MLLVVSGPVDWAPEPCLLPDHAPEAVQEVAFVEDHVSVEEPPLDTDVGLAASDTVGVGGTTTTVAEAPVVPPAPVQARENVLVLVNALLDCVPESGLAPDHAPDAVHEVAPVEDQTSVEASPLAMLVGFAMSDTVGAAGGGGVPETATVAEVLALPPGPVQLRE